MSSAIASAKKRRGVNTSAPVTTVNPASSVNNSQISIQPPQQNQMAGLSLPQILNLFDRRLHALETKERDNTQIGNSLSGSSNENEKSDINEILNEYNNRFNILADEISVLKDIVLKLQSYTMDVNKTLLDERIHILSDLNSNVYESSIKLENNDVSSEGGTNETIPVENIITNESNMIVDDSLKTPKSVSFSLDTIDETTQVIISNETSETEEAFQKFQTLYNEN